MSLALGKAAGFHFRKLWDSAADSHATAGLTGVTVPRHELCSQREITPTEFCAFTSKLKHSVQAGGERRAVTQSWLDPAESQGIPIL